MAIYLTCQNLHPEERGHLSLLGSREFSIVQSVSTLQRWLLAYQPEHLRDVRIAGERVYLGQHLHYRYLTLTFLPTRGV